MFTVEIKDNPIVERVDLRSAKTLSVNAGWRDTLAVDNYVRDVKQMLEERGFPDIEVTANHKLRYGGVIIDFIFYRIFVGETTATSAAARVCQAFQRRLTPIMLWAYANCEKEPVLDQRGLHFFCEDDYLLYMLRFA